MDKDILLPADKEKYEAIEGKGSREELTPRELRVKIYCEALMNGYNTDIAMQLRDEIKLD